MPLTKTYEMHYLLTTGHSVPANYPPFSPSYSWAKLPLSWKLSPGDLGGTVGTTERRRPFVRSVEVSTLQTHLFACGITMPYSVPFLCPVSSTRPRPDSSDSAEIQGGSDEWKSYEIERLPEQRVRRVCKSTLYRQDLCARPPSPSYLCRIYPPQLPSQPKHKGFLLAKDS